MRRKNFLPRLGEAATRVATAYHEAGHAVMATYLIGHIAREGVDIDAGQRPVARFYGRTDLRERTMVLSKMAGWRSECHRLGGERSKDYLEKVIYTVRECVPDASYQDDDEGVIEEMLRENYAITDDEFISRYWMYSSECLGILKKEFVWGSIDNLAAALVARGKLTQQEANEAIGKDLLVCLWRAACFGNHESG